MIQQHRWGGGGTERSDYGGVNKEVEVSEGLVASCFHTVP